MGDRAADRAQALGRRRDRAVLGGVPEAQPEAGPRRRALPRRRAEFPAHPAARPTASRPTSTTGSCCSRTTRCAASRRRAPARPPTSYAAIGAALRELGFKLTRKGIRRGTSEVDRLLTGSQAKALGLVEVLAPRRQRAATRCAGSCCATPSSPPSAPTTRSPASSTPPPAPPATRCWRSPPTTAPRHLRPLLVSGRGLRCAPADAEVLLEALQRDRRGALQAARVGGRAGRPAGLAASQARSGCRARGSSWPPSCSCEGATQRAGRHPRAARRGLELPAAERAGRHDRRHHRRLGAADARPLAAAGPGRPGEGRLQLGRRVRRARPRRAAAPTTSASCASTCTCSRPPRTARSRPARRTCTRSSARSRRRRPSASTRSTASWCARATDRAAARERWQIGTPYRGVELPTLLVRGRAAASRRSRRRAPRAPPQLSQRVPIAQRASAARVAFGALGVATGAPRCSPGSRSPRPASAGPPSGCAPRKRAAAARAAARRRRARASSTPTRSSARCRDEAAGSLQIEPRAAGYLRCELTRRRPRRARGSPPRSTSW